MLVHFHRSHFAALDTYRGLRNFVLFVVTEASQCQSIVDFGIHQVPRTGRGTKFGSVHARLMSRVSGDVYHEKKADDRNTTTDVASQGGRCELGAILVRQL